MQTPTERKAEVVDKIVNLYAENIQVIPTNEVEPQDKDGGTTEGFVSREFANIVGTKTDARGRTIYVGTKA